MNYNNKDYVYRIFESQWKEVILMWLGRPNEQISQQQKEKFIDALVNFEDGCGSFYNYRAYFLAASAMAEFPDYTSVNQIVRQIVNWSLDRVTPDCGKPLLAPLKKNVETILSETNITIVISELLEVIHFYETEDYPLRERAFYLLGKVGNNHPPAIKGLINFINSLENKLRSIDEYARIDAKYIRLKAADSLGKIAAKHPEAISILGEIINSNDKEYNLQEAVDALANFDPSHPVLITKLLEFIEPTEDELNIRQECERIRKIQNPSYSENLYIQYYDGILNKNEKRRLKAFKTLAKISSANSEAITKLLNVINLTNDEITRRKAIQALEEIEDKPNRAILNCLSEILETSQDEYTIHQTAETLSKIYPGNTKLIDKLVELLNSTKDERISIFVADSLGKIGKGNREAIEALEKAIPVKDGFTRMRVAYNLGKIDPDHPAVVPTLEDLTNNLTDNQHRLIAAEKLGEIDKGNKIAFNTLLQALLQTIVDNERMAMEAAYRLTKILQNGQMETVVTNFKNYLSNDKYKNRLNAFYEVLWHCAQNMSYLDFYNAWHNLPPNTHPEAPDNIPVGNSSTTQRLKFAQLPSVLRSAITDDQELKKAVQLVSIDINMDFKNPDILAAYIYAQMVKQGCPECPQGRPTNIQLLIMYWQLDLENLEKRVALLFYNSKADREFSETCLTALSTFGGAIAIITDQPCENVQTISPNDPDLINRVLKWLKRRKDEGF